MNPRSQHARLQSINEEENTMLAAIHIRQTRTGNGPLTCAALVTGDDVSLFIREGYEEADRSLVGLDAFEALHCRADGPVRVHISDGPLRRIFKDVSGSFPEVEFVDIPFGPFGALLQRAVNAIDAHIAGVIAEEEAETQALRASRPPLLVATDASKGRKRRSTGLGCVSETGGRQMRVDLEARSVLEGELLAIEMAVKHFSGRNLHILTDSHLAVAALEGTYQGKAAVMEVVARIHEATKDRSVKVSWVRGHSGHPLNEAAHRLAMAARRFHEAEVPQDVAATIVDNILASLEGSQSPAAA